jgi:hypothetical protein
MKYRLTSYRLGSRRVYLWQIEDEKGNTQTMTLAQFSEYVKELLKPP